MFDHAGQNCEPARKTGESLVISKAQFAACCLSQLHWLNSEAITTILWVATDAPVGG